MDTDALMEMAKGNMAIWKAAYEEGVKEGKRQAYAEVLADLKEQERKRT